LFDLFFSIDKFDADKDFGHSHHVDPCGIEYSPLPRFSITACNSLRAPSWSKLFEKQFLFIFSSLIERDHFILRHWRIPSFLASSGEAAGFLFCY